MNIYICGLILWNEEKFVKKPYFMSIKYLKFEVEISYFLQKFRPASAGWQFYGMELPKTNVYNCDDIITKQLQ